MPRSTSTASEIRRGRPKSMMASNAARMVRPVNNTSSIKMTSLPSIAVGMSEEWISGSSSDFYRLDTM